MVDTILLYVSNGIIFLSFLLYFILIIINKGKKVTDSNSFDVTKEIISEYNSINVIESKNYVTFYNIKRKVIKLDTRTYYGNDLSSVVISLISAGVSVIHNIGNKYIDFFKQVFSNIKILYIFPLLSILINCMTYSLSDSKVSIVCLILIVIINYILIDIKEGVIDWVSLNIYKIKDISKSNSVMIMKFLNKILLLDKFILFGEILMIVRCVLILFDLN